MDILGKLGEEFLSWDHVLQSWRLIHVACHEGRAPKVHVFFKAPQELLMLSEVLEVLPRSASAVSWIH